MRRSSERWKRLFVRSRENTDRRGSSSTSADEFSHEMSYAIALLMTAVL
jgi:hypothetical protein